MSNNPTLSTKRLKLIPFNEEFLTPKYVAWLNDPEVVKFSEQRHLRHTLESCRAYLESYRGSPNFFWAIVMNDLSQNHIGNINAYVDQNNLVADMGILIGEKSHWGKGLGLEAWAAVSDFLLNEKKLRKITAGTMALNEGMLSIMKKSGMLEEGRRFGQFLLDGVPMDMVMVGRFG